MSSSKQAAADLIVFGATGFTGALVAEYLAEHYGTSPAGFTWAVAGRSASKLADLATALHAKAERAVATGKDSMGKDTQRGGAKLTAARHASPPGVRIGDTSDPASLDAMLAGVKACITTVGPYTLYGTALAEACVRNKVHVCDLTGETPWVSQLIDSLDARAEAARVKVVNCCGFDAIPSDLGTLFLARHTGFNLGRVHFYLGPTGGGISGGTIASMMEIMSAPKAAARCAADAYCLVRDRSRATGGDGRDQSVVRYSKDLGGWTIPFVMAFLNTRLVRRSHSLVTSSAHGYGAKFGYAESVSIRSLFKAVLAWLALAVFVLAVSNRPGRWMLGKFLPAPGAGPSRKNMREGAFRIYFVARTDPSAGPVRVVRSRVSGDLDPGYGMTARMIAETGLCLMRGETDDTCAREGGVLTPATAIGAPLIARLSEVGMTFEIDSDVPEDEDSPGNRGGKKKAA